MGSYGLLPILIPMGVVILVFKFRIKFRRIVIIAAILMFFVWILALMRRNIFGSFLYFVPAIILHNYLNKEGLIPVKKTVQFFFYVLVVIVALRFVFPEYYAAGIRAGEETIHIIRFGTTTTGQEDTRMGLGKKFMQDLVLENPWFGTGFDNRWRTLDGDHSGFEATDYPFIGAVAMVGIVGLLFFLPIYVFLIKQMVRDIRKIRLINFKVFDWDAFMIIVFLVYFIFDFLQYMNWFLPISIIDDKKWYVFLGMYCAQRIIFLKRVERGKLDFT
jgi:hypothetical protein